MKPNLNTRFLTILSFLLLTVAILTASTNVWGQCGKTTYRKSVFSSVSNEYREKLLQRLEMFRRNKCEENFEDLYEMLTSSFRQLNKKEDFVKDMKFYYSDNDRFVSFNPNIIGESISPKDMKPSVWFIEGCLTEVINGKKRSIKILLEAIREGEEIFFTDITTRPNPLGNNQKCKS
jgi:hypothetical protein